MGMVARLLKMRSVPGLSRLSREVLYLYGCDIPPEVTFGTNVAIAHRGIGVVLHSRTAVGNDVTIYHGVTIGKASLEGDPGHVVIEDKAILSTGCVIVFGSGTRTIGEGAIVGANAVVTCDIPPWEVWGGVPARKIKDRGR
jgi:serine O-acetyltransferase